MWGIWLKQGHDFVLEEDQDSSHGVPRHGRGIVQQWKKEHGLKHYFNCSGSPDLSPIENAWQPLKQKLRQSPHWTVHEIYDTVSHKWNECLAQSTINKWVKSMPKRLREVIARNRNITPY